MGNPLYSDDVGKMCYNPAKNWQIGWYTIPTARTLLDPRSGSGPWAYDLVGVADYSNNPFSLPIVIKLETGSTTDYFIGFNRAVGVNSQNVQADDQVTITESGANGEGYSQSFLLATMIQGSSYTFTNYASGGYDLVVTVVAINLASNPAVASITISKPPPPTKAPTRAPSRAPSSSPSMSPVRASTKAPTKSPSKLPSSSPSGSPSSAPVKVPTPTPTSSPTQDPTNAPTKAPTGAPSKTPSSSPSENPTKSPTVSRETCAAKNKRSSCISTAGCTWVNRSCVPK